MRGRGLATPLVLLLAALAATARAQDTPPPPATAEAPPPAVTVTAAAPHDPFFLGWGSEPAMEYGGRTVASLQDTVSRLFARAEVSREHPGLAPVWEFPAAATLILLQHEVVGHGGRAREQGLSPSYSFGFLEGATSTERPPETNEELALVGVGGVESDGVMADRILRDALRPEGVDGAKLPLALMAKLDLSVYVATCPEPKPGDSDTSFGHAYQHGNDMAIYLVARQAQRLGGDPTDVWNGVYEPVYAEALLHDSWRDARAAALWNLLDPSLGLATYAWFRQHVLGGSVRVHPPALRLGEDLRLTVGTRAALGPQAISRFLDVHLGTPLGLATVYVRDLDSSVDRTWGYGAAIDDLALGPLRLSAHGDTWTEPTSREGLHTGSGWNASAEARWSVGRAGLAAMAGSKSLGYFPGTPQGKGGYVAVGLTAAW